MAFITGLLVTGPSVLWRAQRPARKLCMMNAEPRSASMSTLDVQWAALVKNTGVWEGSLTIYDNNAVEMSREPSVLFVEAEGGALSDMPYNLQFFLRRLTSLTEVRETCIRGDDMAKRGRVFDIGTGSMCSGGLLLPPYVFEQVLNFEGGRARLVTRYDDRRLRRFTVFRERKGVQTRSSDIGKTAVNPSVVASCAPWLEINDEARQDDSMLDKVEVFAGRWAPVSSSFTKADGSTEVISSGNAFSLNGLGNFEDAGRQLELNDGSVLSAFGGGIGSRAPHVAPTAGMSASFEFFVRRRSVLHVIARKYKEGRYIGTEFNMYNLAG